MKGSLKLKTVLTTLIAAVLLMAAAAAISYQVYSGTIRRQYKTMTMNLAKTEAVTVNAEDVAEVRDEVMKIYRNICRDNGGVPDFGNFTQEQWETLVKPFDEQVLSVCRDRDEKINFLHMCGEPEYRFRVDLQRLRAMPGDIVNWSVKDNGLSLQDGRAFFGNRPILGGMNNKQNLVSGTEEAIFEEAQSCHREAGTTGFLMGADCTVQPPAGQKLEVWRIRAAVQAALDFQD